MSNVKDFIKLQTQFEKKLAVLMDWEYVENQRKGSFLILLHEIIPRLRPNLIGTLSKQVIITLNLHKHQIMVKHQYLLDSHYLRRRPIIGLLSMKNTFVCFALR